MYVIFCRIKMDRLQYYIMFASRIMRLKLAPIIFALITCGRVRRHGGISFSNLIKCVFRYYMIHGILQCFQSCELVLYHSPKLVIMSPDNCVIIMDSFQILL